MLQVLLAAAVAGLTGFVAKRLFSSNANHQQENETPVEDAKIQNPLALNGYETESGYDSNCEKQDGIFKFSSSGCGKKSGTRSGAKNLRNKFKFRSCEVEEGNGSGKARRFSVCLKRMKTCKNVAAKCGSCSSKDNSLFCWGLGVGMMYIMSTGKAEISKLNLAMDETAKVVQELKAELYKRKLSRKIQVSSSLDEVAANPNEFSSELCHLTVIKSSTKLSAPHITDDGECSSSVLTEEPEPEPGVLEIAQLEAELESELQKLPWCITKAFCHEGMRSNLTEENVAQTEDHELQGQDHEMQGQSFDYYQSHGVLPSELDKKLCHLRIEQQENQIVELESELHLAQSKLQEKESELQALKDCIKRLTEFSLSTVFDAESEVLEEQECTELGDDNIKMGPESRKSMVGMKRPIDF
ncbi:hypothetical protein CFOL_v3_12370 [Cephalotus follicularis]|uniref:POLAR LOCALIZATION DURING ASYMMETRIC DIVISION AND protein n=1 Tax=Cephalotus follicularis TaxID=3775 RepID=A0A1Q3BLG7_CEPFO|nr:hypothetical protein CFOL_v3_12370 [Cephalotus follicularis]